VYQRSLKIYEAKLGPEHPDVATSLNNLALLYQDMAQYAKAEPLLPALPQPRWFWRANGFS
jgi:Tetratricopeptide repeat